MIYIDRQCIEIWKRFGIVLRDSYRRIENFSVSFSRLRSCTEYSQFSQNHSCSSFIFAFNMRLFCGTLRPRKVCGTPAWRRIIILKFYELNLQRVASCSCTWPGPGASVLCAFQFGQRHTHTHTLWARLQQKLLVFRT